MPSKNRRIVFEGIPGAGKTSHASRLSKAFDLPLIPEFVGFTDQEWRAARLKIPFYFANDEAKEYMANLFTDSCLLFDRHYTGALAYGYALTEVRGARSYDEESYAGNFRWYQGALKAGRLSQPDQVFVLEISPETSLRRQPRARASDPLWGDVVCLQTMLDYYRLFYTQIEPKVKTVWIDAEQPQEIVYQLLYDHLEPIVTARVA